jgi:hypothetical protein
MGKGQRIRGSVYEREVVKVFSDYFAPHDFARNIGQARDGGNDIDVGRLVIECKRRKKMLTIDSWMQQAEAACDREQGKVPIVVARADQGQSLVILTLEDFLSLADEAIQRSLP